MAERWFRLYDDAVNDPKVQTLPPYLFKFWICFLCLASKSDGVVHQRYIKMLSYRHQDAFNAVSKLISYGLIDEVEGHWEPHNWRRRQYKSDTSAERMRRHRHRQSDVTVTPPDTDTETERVKKLNINNINLPNSCTDTTFAIAPGQPEWEAWERHYLDRKKPLPLAMQRVKDGVQKAMTVKTRFPPS